MVRIDMGRNTMVNWRMMDYLNEKLNVPGINISHRKENIVAGALYESFRFVTFGGDEENNYVMLELAGRSQFCVKPQYP